MMGESNTPREPADPDDILIPARERNEYRAALIRIEALAGELEGRHTGFIHIGRMARLALREYDRAK